MTKNIIQYTANDPPRNDYPRKITSPPFPSECCGENNRISVGVIGALLERPREQWPAFVGFDDFELAAELGITVIAHDPPQMGRRAADLAMRRLDEPSDCATIEMIAARLVPRGSGEVLAT